MHFQGQGTGGKVKEEKGRWGKGKVKKYFRIIKSKFPYILHPRTEFHDFKAGEEELQKIQYKTQSTTMQNVFLRAKTPPLLMCC